MALIPDYGHRKGPALKKHSFGSRVVEVTRSVFSGSVTNQEIPRLLSMQSMNQLKGQQRPAPTLLPAPVYRARLNTLGVCRNYGLVPGKLVTDQVTASRHGNQLPEIAINDCGILHWALQAKDGEPWRPLKVEWFDNRVTYHEHVGLVLIEKPRQTPVLV